MAGGKAPVIRPKPRSQAGKRTAYAATMAKNREPLVHIHRWCSPALLSRHTCLNCALGAVANLAPDSVQVKHGTANVRLLSSSRTHVAVPVTFLHAVHSAVTITAVYRCQAACVCAESVRFCFIGAQAALRATLQTSLHAAIQSVVCLCARNNFFSADTSAQCANEFGREHLSSVRVCLFVALQQDALAVLSKPWKFTWIFGMVVITLAGFSVLIMIPGR